MLPKVLPAAGRKALPRSIYRGEDDSRGRGSGARGCQGRRSLLSGLMRTATTDEHARRWFRRYWTFGVGSGAHILVHALLEMVRETAERSQTAAAGQAQ